MKRRFTFKSVVAAFGKSPYRIDPLDSADQLHLERWAADPRAESIWNRFLETSVIGTLPERTAYTMASNFVAVALAIRREANATGAAYEEYSAEQNRVKAGTLEAQKALMWAIKRIAYAATTGKNDPSEWRARARLLHQAGDLCMQQITKPAEAPKAPPSAPKRHLFSGRMSQHFRLMTGLWCDGEVAALTEIAFPGKEFTVDMVRTARRKP